MPLPLAFLHSATGLHIPRPVLYSIAARLHSYGFSGIRSGGPSDKTASDLLVERAEAETVNRLKRTYLENIVPLLIQEFNYANIHQVPKLDKIVVKCGTGDAARIVDGFRASMTELALITGQSPYKTGSKNDIAASKFRKNQPLGNPSKKNISTFKGKEVSPVGSAVTLRGNMMYSFLDRLIKLGLPRLMDFQGVSPRFNGKGNYSIRFGEQCAFPEISTDLLGGSRGMDVHITTTANTDSEAYKLLALMGMPFKEGGTPTK